MKFTNVALVNAQSANQLSIASSAIDTNQIIKMSAQVDVTAGGAAGSLQLQVSNDICNYGNLPAGGTSFTPTNWSSLGSPVTVAGTGITLVAQQDMCYRWMRALFTSTSALVNTVTAVADVASSLNSKYFTITNGSGAGFYVWINVDGAGVDPAVPGKTGKVVAISANDSANTIATALRALSIAGITITGATNQAIFTNTVAGPATPAADGAAPTGFTFANTVPAGTITVNLMCLSI